MSDIAADIGVPPAPPRKRNANLGSADAEEIFASFDPRIIRRFFAYLKPHRPLLIGAQVAVLISALTSVGLPWIIGRVVSAGVAHRPDRLENLVIIFGAIVTVNACSSFCDQWMTSRLAQKVIFDVRRSMFLHFQDVALTFMDKTHVGRIMSRLQGDVNALQEFLESSTG
ncbi:MAG TPA: ABC transporter transmembrane domain-containing protein, partial [Caulobacteraceae bacterium]